MSVFRRFRLSVVRWSLVVTGIATGIAWYLDPAAGQGLLIGGLAAVVGFWIFARQMEKLARLEKSNVHSHVLRWSGVRLALYGAAIYKGYTLDPDTMYGLLGAVIGIFIIRFVTVFFGVTGLDLSKEEG